MSDADLLAEVAEGLPFVTAKRMFGHATLFAGSRIFVLVDDGRVAVRLPDERAFAEAMAIRGAAGFDPMRRGKGMGQWVVLPAEMLDEPMALRGWVRRAHALALVPPAAPKRTAAKRKR